MKEDTSLQAIPAVIVTGIAHDFKQFISSRIQMPLPEGHQGHQDCH